MINRLLRRFRKTPLQIRKEKKEAEVEDLLSTLWGMEFWVTDRAPWPAGTSNWRWWVRSINPNRIMVLVSWTDSHPLLKPEQSYEMDYTRGQAKLVGVEGILKSAIHDAILIRVDILTSRKSQ